MAQYAKFLLLIFCQCIVFISCTEESDILTTTESYQTDVKQIIVDALNDKGGEFTYSSPNIINVHRQNESDNLSLIHVTVSADCKGNATESCFSSELVCEVLILDDPITETKEIVDGYSLCGKKESELLLPTGGQGFLEVPLGKRAGLAEPVIQELLENDPQRSVVEVMSLKKMECNGTQVFLTLKVTKTDGTDTSRFEVLEIQQNRADNSTMKDYFPLESNLPNILLSGDDMTQVAQDAVLELDSLSPSNFTYALLDILNAEKIVTPGSEGVLTSLELRLAPSVCLKRTDADELSVERECVESNVTAGRMVCRIVRWDRPWHEDTLYSVPVCHREEPEVVSEAARLVEGSLESSSELQPLQPVVEEPFFVEQAHCTGCATDLALDSPALQLLTEQALTQLDERSSSQYKHALVRIVKAQKQVVNGVKYTLHLEVGETSCPKDSLEDRSTCSVERETQTCIFEYFERPWLQLGRELVRSNCTDPHDNNQLQNEIEPHHVAETMADRQSIFDYIDAAMDEPFRIHDSPSFVDDDSASSIPYGEDGLVEPSRSDPPLESSEEAMLKPAPKHVPASNSEESEEQVDRHQAYYVGTLRQRRETEKPLFGGLKDIESSEQELVSKLAKFAVEMLDNLDPDDEKRSVISVLEAKKQLTSGITYHLKIRVGFTNCPENSQSVAGCTVTETRVCDVQLLKSFANTTPRDVQVVKSECFPEVAPGKHRQKRSLVGGAHMMDVKNPVVVNITKFAAAGLDQISSSPYTQKFVRIINATSQVVSGRKVTTCFEVGPSKCLKNNNGVEANDTCELQDGVMTQVCCVKVWDQPWLNKREIVGTECQSSNSRRKREAKHSGTLVGAPADADVNDSYIQKQANFALQELDRRSNSPYSHVLIEVVSARKQVVAGTLTHLVLRVGHSTCRKGQNNTEETCELRENSLKQECSVEVWDRPWLKERKINSVTCTPVSAPERTKRATKKIGGGSHDINLSVFRKFMTTHNKQYKDKAEMKYRFHVFRANMMKVKQLQDTEQGTAKYGPTVFADLTAKEFKQYLGLNQKLRQENRIPLPHAAIPDFTLPKDFDWRNYNAVTPVKNQGMCGSCWAFSVTGNVEGQYAIKTGNLLSLSEQELVDCDKLDEGCNGGLPENAYKAIEELGGLETESDYPYDGADETCHFKKSMARVQVAGGVNITTNETKMAQWLVKNGPISIGINANAMQFYMGGVSHPWKFLCDPNNLDHGVLIVGYGVHTTKFRHKTLPYWTIKNSWGGHWGEKGYYRVYRGDGTCGVNMMATSAVLE